MGVPILLMNEGTDTTNEWGYRYCNEWGYQHCNEWGYRYWLSWHPLLLLPPFQYERAGYYTYVFERSAGGTRKMRPYFQTATAHCAVNRRD